MVHGQALTAVLGALWLALPLGGTDPNFGELLDRATAKVTANDQSMRNYTCVETVRREYFRPRASTLPRACSLALQLREHPTPDMVLVPTSMDRLRVEVLSTQAGETYSPIGSGQFENANLHHAIPQGPFGTGIFGAFLSVVFRQDVKKFAFAGETMVEGRRLFEYSFDVAQPDSHYGVQFVDRKGSFMSAYGGSVLVDAETAEPFRLLVRTAELPEAAGACQTIATMDYGRVKIGERDLILPKLAGQRFISADGHEVQNTVAFSDCREYSSVSRLIYDDPSAPGPAAQAKPAAVIPERIPENLRFQMELTAPIDSDTAARGDRFTATLTEPLRDGKRVLAPKGAVVEGRISMLQIFHEPQEEVFLGLTPELVEIRGVPVPMDAWPDSRAILANRRARGQKMQIFLPPRGEHSGTFRMLGLRAQFARGFTSSWVTAAPIRRQDAH